MLFSDTVCITHGITTGSCSGGQIPAAADETVHFAYFIKENSDNIPATHLIFIRGVNCVLFPKNLVLN